MIKIKKKGKDKSTYYVDGDKLKLTLQLAYEKNEEAIEELFSEFKIIAESVIKKKGLGKGNYDYQQEILSHSLSTLYESFLRKAINPEKNLFWCVARHTINRAIDCNRKKDTYDKHYINTDKIENIAEGYTDLPDDYD